MKSAMYKVLVVCQYFKVLNTSFSHKSKTDEEFNLISKYAIW